MDPSYKIRNFFLTTTKKIKELKEQELKNKTKKLRIIKELEEDLFYLKEATKKKIKEKKINENTHEKIKTKIINTELEIRKIKKELTNP